MKTIMSNSNDKSELLRELAIFDYVAGNQTDSAKRNFEIMLEQDATLRDAVEAERRLRAGMLKAGESTPVSMSNFDLLLKKIDAEQQSTDNNVTALESNVTKIGDRSRTKYIGRTFAVAASMAVFAIIFSTVYQPLSEPKFETLSDTLASDVINFSQLAEQSRLAKMTLDQNLSGQQIDELLRGYGLSSFEGGAEQHQRYVVAESAITNSELSLWRSDAGVLEVELFVVSSEE